MKKHFVFVFLILLGSLSLFAQSNKSFELFLGEEFADKNLTLPPSIFATDGSGYYLFQNKMAAYVAIAFIPIKVSKEASYLRKFDKNLNSTISEEIILGSGRTAEDPILAYSALGNLHLFSTLQDKGDRKHLLYHRSINKKDLSYPAEGKLLTEVSYDGFPRYRYPNFNFERSRDSSKVLLHYQLPNVKDAPDRFKVHVFNEEMIELWNAPFTLPYPENQLFIQSFELSNEGRVYVLAKYYDTPKAKAYNYTYKLFVLTPGFEKADEYDLGFRDKPLSNLQLQMEPDDDIVCVGSYMAGDGKWKSVEGVFFFKLNGTTLERETERLIEIPTEMVRDLMSEDMGNKSEKKKKKMEERTLNSIHFNDVVLRSDGGLLMVGEISYSYTTSYYVSDGQGGGYWVYKTVYVSGDILTFTLDPEGEIERIDRIRKYQRQEESNVLLSYGMAITRDKLRFVYNDRIENLPLSQKESPRLYVPSFGRKNKQLVTLASLDAEGNIKKEGIVSVKEAEMYAFPREAKQVSGSEMIIVLQKGKKRRLAKITFK